MIKFRKKKLIVILSILALFVLVLTGCNGAENSGNGQDDGTLNQPQQEEQIEPEELPKDPPADNEIKEDPNNPLPEDPAPEELPEESVPDLTPDEQPDENPSSDNNLSQ